MNSNLLQDVGENFEYVKTIVQNTIELKKIEAAESAAEIMGKVLFGIISFFILLLVFIGLVIVGVIWLASFLGSVIQATALFCGVGVLLILVLYIFRKPLLYSPCISFIDSRFTLENQD